MTQIHWASRPRRRITLVQVMTFHRILGFHLGESSPVDSNSMRNNSGLHRIETSGQISTQISCIQSTKKNKIGVFPDSSAF